MTLVFQYGSNTSSERLNSNDRLEGEAVSRGLAYTQDCFELDFTHDSKSEGYRTSDLVPGRGRQIYGVLYEIPGYRVCRSLKREGKKTLDEIEGEGQAYKRTCIIVIPVGQQSTPVEAITYLVKNRKAGCKTKIRYVEHIIRGLREHNAPEEYLQYVKYRVICNNPCLRDEMNNL
jgi:gamma-glutamylcyclotransferase